MGSYPRKTFRIGPTSRTCEKPAHDEPHRAVANPFDLEAEPHALICVDCLQKRAASDAPSSDAPVFFGASGDLGQATDAQLAHVP